MQEHTEEKKNQSHPLRKVRSLKNLTRKELSNKTGVSQSCIQRIENGQIQNPALKTRKKLANGLNVEDHVIARWFMDDIENIPPEDIAAQKDY